LTNYRGRQGTEGEGDEATNSLSEDG